MEENFRDHVSHIDAEGHRVFFHPKKPHGKLYQWRTILSYAYLLVFFTLPFVRIQGKPLFLFDLLERRYILFGLRFWPQDFFIFVVGMLAFIVFIALFTVIFGRIFCGWICPQTIFMEMVFRKIEYWVDGDAAQQRALLKMKWTAEKMRKRVLKFSLFTIFSFLVGNTFLAYVIGTDHLWAIVTEPLAQHVGGFALMLIFTGVFLFVYSWFREQVCLVVCPYGRMQGVLLDKKSIVVTYDHVRGEPRHKAHKGEKKTGEGDCIDCMACVHVCPTGIDIRNGTQLECINCTACIDACDHIMESVHQPKGLIRYDSEEGVSTKTPWKITPRVIGYSILLLLIVLLEITLLATRSDIGMSIIRARGTLFTTEEDGSISNLYNIKLINKTEAEMKIELRLKDHVGAIKWIGHEPIIPPAGTLDAEFFLNVPVKEIPDQKNKWKMECWMNGEKIGSDNITFIAPHQKK